jgi:hypothetical protein
VAGFSIIEAASLRTASLRCGRWSKHLNARLTRTAQGR